VSLVATFTAILIKPAEINSGFIKKTGKQWRCAKLSLLAVDETAQYFCVTLWDKQAIKEVESLKAGAVLQGEGKIDVKAWASGTRSVKSAIYIVPTKPIIVVKGNEDAV